jgi:acetyl-CoA acetyltransferase
MSDVYILGVDMIKFGRFPERTVPSLGAEAALMALDDAGLSIQDMQALYCGNLGQSSAMVGQRILQEIGQTGIPVVNFSNACATGATAFREAWTSIKADLYDVVLAVGVEQMGKGLLGGAGGGKGIPKEGLLGSGTMPAAPNRPFPICSTPTASTTSYKSALIEVHASLKAVAPVAQAFEKLTTGIPVCPIS